MSENENNDLPLAVQIEVSFRKRDQFPSNSNHLAGRLDAVPSMIEATLKELEIVRFNRRGLRLQRHSGHVQCTHRTRTRGD